MSVIRIPRKIKTFEYEGAKFGLRRLRVGEMAELTRLTSLYLASTRKELKQVVEDKITEFAVVQGDLGLMHDAQVYLAKTAVIDVTSQLPIFSGDEKIEDIDNDFINVVWNTYNTTDEVKSSVPDDKKEEPARPLDLKTTPLTTTLSSAETSSV